MSRIKLISCKLHLWIGLLFGTVFVILGLTGSAIAWLHELDHVLNPDLLQTSPPPGLTLGTPIKLSPTDIQAVSDALSANPRYGRPSMLIFLSMPAVLWSAGIAPRQRRSLPRWHWKSCVR